MSIDSTIDGTAGTAAPDGGIDIADADAYGFGEPLAGEDLGFGSGAAPGRTAADDYRALDITQIRDVIGHPIAFIAEKKEPVIGEMTARFIAHSTFFVVGTADEEGRVDTSPRGDPPGTVKVLDPWTLAIPDRPGNKLADTFENLTRNPRASVVFFVPGMRETVRVTGDAFVTDEPELLERMSAGGKPAVLAIVVRVREVFGQCGKAVIRAKLWQDDDRGLADAVTAGGDVAALLVAESAGKMAGVIGSGGSGAVGAMLEDEYRNGLF